MKLFYTCLFVFLLFGSNVYADYTTPNTAVKWTLNDLVSNSAGNVTYNSGTFLVSGIITISATDTLSITTDEVVKFDSGYYFQVNGSLKINPPNAVVFTANNQTKGFNGLKFSFSPASVIRKLTLEYAISCNLTDCSPSFDSCIFQYNNVHNTNTTFGNGSISLFRSSPLITNCKFLNNKRAAIQGGGNIANAPKVMNCLFMGNNTTNQNVPQINIGGTGTDTMKIINNKFLAASTNSGAIGVLPVGIDARVLINGNLIQNNRYGINLQGGSLINSVVSYNIIDGNNVQNNPNLGGSGIAFSGGSSTSHQNSIVTGNVITGNLWGITIQNGAKPNLGNLGNSDTTDDGKNWFANNTNTTTPGINLYNNSPDPITAQGNYWGSNDPSAVEASIYHQPDNAALGLVDYANNVLPVTLLSFSALLQNDGAMLTWKTTSEADLDRFEIERSTNGRNFEKIGSIVSGRYVYSFFNSISLNVATYYRLKMIDKNGAFKYSSIISVKPGRIIESTLRIYPIPTARGSFVAELTIDKSQQVRFNFYDAAGRLLTSVTESISAGKTILPLSLNAGTSFIHVVSESINKTIPVISH